MAASPVALRIGTLVLLVVVLGLIATALRWNRPATGDRMAILDHVEELRRRFLWATAVWIVGTFVAFGARFEWRGDWPVLVPAVADNVAAQVFRAITNHIVPDSVQLIVTRPIDGFVAEIYVAAGLGFALALPVILWQVGRFVGPALQPREKSVLKATFLPALLLFAGGATFAWIVVLPFLMETLYGYSEALGAQSLLSISELVGFTVTMIMVFGISFQMPLVMYALARTGLVTSGAFVRSWRYAVVGIIIFSAVVTDPTVISQMLVAGPLVLLYGAGIIAARLGQKKLE